LVLIGNLLGSIFMAWLVFESELWKSGNVAYHAVAIATAKCGLSFDVAFIRGVLCNWLVCLAVFMATSSRDITGKILSCLVPITAFVASGFEHSIANMYFIPAGLFISALQGGADQTLTWWTFFTANIIPVTLGNIVGGALFVASVYWYIHLPSTTRN
jgi:formate/nitrite transporter